MPDAVAVVALIVGGVLLRALLAATIGLGVDESYAFAVSRPFSASYLDHPPLVFWIVGATRALGSSPWLLRAPFIALFAATTWLLYRTTVRLYGERAGFFAVVVVSLAPVFTVSSASWILPDGPLLFGLALAAFAATTIRFGSQPARTRDWSTLGIGVGIAALAKYHAVLFAASLVLWCVTDPEARRHLRSRGPWLAAIVAAVLATPVLVWNAQHQWASVRFQLSRTGGAQPPLVALAESLGGQAGYLLPWIWIPMLIALVRAGRRGPRDARSWFLCCLAVVPIALFTLVSLRGSPGLPHWPAPGYFFLAPLVGRDIVTALQSRHRRRVQRALVAAAGVLVVLGAIVASQARTGWLSNRVPRLFRHGDPSLELLDWTSLAHGMDSIGLAGVRVVEGTSWIDCAKLGYALAPSIAVRCATSDPRHFRYLPPVRDATDDVLVVTRGHAPPGAILVPITRGGRPAFFVNAYLARASAHP